MFLAKADQEATSIIAINSKEPVLEKSAQSFNESLLGNLLQEQQVDDAFKNSIGIVAGEANDCHVCCCFHGHKEGCLWVLYEKMHGKEKAHELHTVQCSCYKYSKVENDHSSEC